MAIRFRSCRAKWGVEAPISWRTSSSRHLALIAETVQAAWVLGLAHLAPAVGYSGLSTDASDGSALLAWADLQQRVEFRLGDQGDRRFVADQPAVIVDTADRLEFGRRRVGRLDVPQVGRQPGRDSASGGQQQQRAVVGAGRQERRRGGVQRTGGIGEDEAVAGFFDAPAEGPVGVTGDRRSSSAPGPGPSAAVGPGIFVTVPGPRARRAPGVRRPRGSGHRSQGRCIDVSAATVSWPRPGPSASRIGAPLSAARPAAGISSARTVPLRITIT